MIRIGWFTPISAETGIAHYSQCVLEALARQFPSDELEVVVFHPATDADSLAMPFPMIEISENLLRSDFDALFDVAVYHLGNNDLNHGPIFAALLRHPGVAVMHDHVYLHYLAGASVRNGHVGAGFGALVHEAGGPEAFTFLAESGALRCDQGAARFTPWETGWAAEVPLSAQVARMALGAVVHSGFAERGLGAEYPGSLLRLFMPRPAGIEAGPRPGAHGGRLHLVASGHIGRTKGLLRLVEAFRREPALAEAFRVTIAGFASDPVFLDTLREEIDAAHLHGTIDLRIAPDERQLEQLMAAADLFYNLRFPNTEGASLSLVEQLAHGRPVIAYRSGCFAEIPEEAAFLLDRQAGTEDLVALLKRIAAERETLGDRGAAARRHVEDATAERYATELVAFLRSKRDSLQQRAELLCARRRKTLPVPGDEARWFRAAIDARRAIGGLFDGTLLVPDNFPALSPEAKGRYVALNLLDTRTDPESEARIGQILEELDPVDLCRVLGELTSCARIDMEGRTDAPVPLSALRPLGCSLAAWRILAAIPPDRAVSMALAALDHAHDPDEAAALLRACRRSGFRAAMREWLRESGPVPGPPRDVLDWLQRPEIEELEKSKPVPRGSDLLARARGANPDTELRFHGFHGPEEIGVWTARKRAALFLNAGEDGPASLSVAASTLPAAGNAQVLTVTELRSGRVTEATRDSAERRWTWEAALDGFKGPLRITVECPRLLRPCDTMDSADPRALGVLLERVTLG